MAHWICTKCGNEVLTQGDAKPSLPPWSDGHKCTSVRLDTLTPEEQDKLIDRIEASL